MKQFSIFSSLTAMLLFMIPATNFAQAPNLGAASPFAVFTAVGAFNNLGPTVITGDVGTDAGPFNGFPPGVVIGQIHLADPVSAQAAIDVNLAYGYMSTITCGTVIGVGMGNGQLLAPGVYCTGAATTLNGNLILDAQGNPDALFIFKIGGAFASGVASNIVLINSASLCNVYWQMGGAVSLGQNSTFRGTMLVDGAISLLDGAALFGRGLSTAGAISTNNNLITIGLPPICTITGNDLICSGQSTQLCAPVGMSSYLWSTGANTPCITVNATGNYAVTITSPNGCSSVCNKLVTVTPPPVCTITGNNSICAGGQTTQLCASPGATGYLWNTGATTACITVNAGGIYTVIVTDLNGCTSSCSETVTVNPLPICLITGNNFICQAGQSTQLCALPGASGYLWNTGAITDCITVNAAGIYTVTITDLNGCTSTCSETVTVMPMPVCTITGNNFICAAGQTTELCAPPGAIGYLWNTGAITDCITVSLAGIYTVTVTFAGGCTSTCSLEVTVMTMPVCAITGNNLICEGQSTLFCVPPGATAYLWNTGATTNCITASTAGTYSVVITFPGGCTSTCSTTLIVNPLPICTILGNNPICEGEFSTLCAPPGYASYLWNTGEITNCITTNVAGPYSVTVTSASGCSSICSIILGVNPLPVCTISGGNLACPGQPTQLCAPAGAAGYLWNTGAITNCIFVTLPGTYSVTVTNPGGCTSVCSRTVIADIVPPVIIFCPANVAISCSASPLPANTGTATATDNCTLPPTVTYTDVIIPGNCPQNYSITRTWRATDGTGNFATCIQQITVSDNTPPTISCPPGLNLQCANQVPAVNLALVTTTDNCGAVGINVSDVYSNQTCINRFTLTRTYHANDGCGNTATCNQVMTIFDNTLPTITFPNPLLVNGGTILVQCFGQDPNWDIPTYNAGDAVATDNCLGGVTVTYMKTLESTGNCAIDGYILINRHTWTATDACGNVRTAVVFQKLIDVIPPVIVGVPADVTVDCSAMPALPVAILATDECLCACVMLFDETVLAPGCQNGQVILRSWKATDQCGNETIRTQRITLIDKTPPQIQISLPELAGLPNGTILNFTCNEGGIPEFFNSLDASSVAIPSVCGNGAVLDFDTDLIVANYCKTAGYIEQRSYTWTAGDECGNLSTLTIFARLIDTEPPVLIGVPTLACLTDPLLNNIEVIDNCEQATVEFHDFLIANPCGAGTAFRRIYTGYDDCGNLTRDTAIIIPNDGAKPVIKFVNPVLKAMLPSEVLVIDCAKWNGQYTAFGINDVSVTDACQTGVEVDFSEKLIATGDCSTTGILSILELKWTATDFCGNIGQLTITAHVKDTTSPVFDQFVSEMTIPCNAAMPKNTASDNCGSVAITTQDSIIAGNCPFEYEMRRLVTATDPCGNATTKLQIIHVGDGSGPTITGVEKLVCDDLSLPVVTAYDPCAEKFVPVSMHQDTVIMPCLGGYVIERFWSATDSCGHKSEIRQTIVLNDHTPPKLLIPDVSEIRQFMGPTCTPIRQSQTDLLLLLDAMKSDDVVVFDDCDQDVQPVLTVFTSLADDCLVSGFFQQKSYTWTATDACGNASSISFCINIQDDIPPVITAVPFEDSIVCAPMPPVPPIVASDLASTTTIGFIETTEPGAGPGVFIITRTWTATDACGNVSVYVQRITWIPNTLLDCNIILPPMPVECNSHGVMIVGGTTGGIGPFTYVWEVVGEDCFIQSGPGSPKITIYIGWTPVKIILTVTDRYGCSSMCMTTLSCTTNMDNAPGNLPLNTILPATTTAGKAQLQQLNLWPNPATEQVNLSFESLTETEVEISLSDLLGRVVFLEKFRAQKGLNTHQMEVPKIPEGGYQMRLKTATEMQTKGVVILRN